MNGAENILVAVAVDDFGKVSNHAGRALHWHVYVKVGVSEPAFAWTIELTAPGSLHEWHVREDSSRHPLHFVDAAIAGSAGKGVVRNLANRGTNLIQTIETNPLKAVNDYFNGELESHDSHNDDSCLDPKKKSLREATVDY